MRSESVCRLVLPGVCTGSGFQYEIVDFVIPGRWGNMLSAAVEAYEQSSPPGPVPLPPDPNNVEAVRRGVEGEGG